MANFSMYKSDEEMADMVTEVKSRRYKDFRIVPEGRFGMFKVMWDEKNSGILPASLSGLFTSRTNAEKAVGVYVKNQKPNFENRQKEDAARKKKHQEEKQATEESNKE